MGGACLASHTSLPSVEAPCAPKLGLGGVPCAPSLFVNILCFTPRSELYTSGSGDSCLLWLYLGDWGVPDVLNGLCTPSEGGDVVYTELWTFFVLSLVLYTMFLPIEKGQYM